MHNNVVLVIYEFGIILETQSQKNKNVAITIFNQGSSKLYFYFNIQKIFLTSIFAV